MQSLCIFPLTLFYVRVCVVICEFVLISNSVIFIVLHYSLSSTIHALVYTALPVAPHTNPC